MSDTSFIISLEDGIARLQLAQSDSSDTQMKCHWGTLLVMFLLTLFAKMVHFAHATPSPT